MPIHTVLGPIQPDELGPTTMHEHLLVDGGYWYSPADPPEVDPETPISLDNAGVLRWSYFGFRDNLRLDDADELARELRLARDAGASCVVDLTIVGLGRRVAELPALARAAGLHVVVGCGFYVHPTHPAWIDDATVDELTQQLVDELRVGIDGTAVRAGLIGEIGTSDPIVPNELKILRAAGAAAVATGAAVNVHQNVGRHGLEIVDVLVREGMAPGRIVISHMDDDLDPAYQRALAQSGAVLEFDTFGHEFYPDRARRYPTDFERLDAIALLLEEGFADQIVLGCDVWTKGALRSYGGMGYEHLFKRVVPMLRTRAGAGDREVEQMLVGTPRRLLDRP